jgi:transcriptional regulator with GAF, ATPase, and Fis domain
MGGSPEMMHEPDPAGHIGPTNDQAADAESAAARELLRGLDRGVSFKERALLAAEEERTREEIANLKRSVGAYSRLISCARSLTSILDLDELLGAVLQEVVALCGVDRGFLLLSDPNGRLQVERGFDAILGHLDSSGEAEVSRSLAQRAFEDRKTQWVSDALRREEFRTQESIQSLQLSVIGCIPIVTSQRGAIGVLYLDSRRPENLLAPEDREILEAFAAQAAIAIENAKLHQELIEERAGLERENRDLRRALPGARGVATILGRSRGIELLRRRIAQVQEVHSPVLVQGETGTGKDLVARAIHAGSLRSSGAYLAIHCGALPSELLESEVFGHKKGSFTGALQDKQGLFEAASGGTLLLDEIGEMSIGLQAKLLRALESGEIRRVGENFTRKVDVRIITATHRNLEEMIAHNQFREDLYYRLKVVTLTVPPLRERVEDILLLAEEFLRTYLKSLMRPNAGFTEAAARYLLEHPWPGNVRELKNLIEGTCAFVKPGDPIDAADLALMGGTPRHHVRMSPGADSAGLREAREEAERQHMLDALDVNDWNVSRTAKALGISRQHLHNRIRHYGLERPNGRYSRKDPHSAGKV